jgi:pyridoxine 5-phosphate synthase
MNTRQEPIRLGINIDHVATVRNARGGTYPDPVRAARLARAAGADLITAHLREDRRHIRDEDIARLSAETDLPLNLEMAATEEMGAIARRFRPHACCLVPERRQELTTEGGLDAARAEQVLMPYVAALRDAGIQVSLFIEADPAQIEAANRIGADAIELHTGAYCDLIAAGDPEERADRLLARMRDSARQAHAFGLEVHAGHGLTYDSVGPIASIPEIVELNIGHFLVGEAIFVGLEHSIRRMRDLMSAARSAMPVPSGAA